jgi:RNA polymerase sigma-70 factor (ECF subfamily)
MQIHQRHYGRRNASESDLHFSPLKGEHMGTTAAGIVNGQGIAPELCNNDSREMDWLLPSCLPSFRRKAFRYLGNLADAEDAVQDALLSAYKHRDQFKGQAQMSTWVTAIVVNSARMQLRKRPRQLHVSLDEPWGNAEEGYCLADNLAARRPSPEDECRASELIQQLRLTAEMLSPSLRTTFRLRECDGLSIRETASLLGVPHGTVKAQLARARTRVKELLRPRLDGSSRPVLSIRRRRRTKNKEVMELKVRTR